MSYQTINKSLQKTLISPLTHDLLWSQYLEVMADELQNMHNKYSEIKNNWNTKLNDKDNLVRISESFGYTPNLIINNTINMAKLEIDSIPYRIREKTTYSGYSLIFQQNNSLGDTFNYYWNGKKLIKAINYVNTIENLNNSNHYSPFTGITAIKNYSSILNSDRMNLDYLINGKIKYDEENVRIYSLDQTIGSSVWKLDTSYIQIPTKHLGIEYFPQNYYCTYNTSLGIAIEDEYIYETQIQYLNLYIPKSMCVRINNIPLTITIESDNNREYFSDNEGYLAENSYFDLSSNLVHLEFNKIPTDYEISICYKINLFMTSDYFYYLEQGMEYNRRCPIIPHCGVFVSADIASSRGSDFYYPNEGNYTVPDLKLKAITASSYNRHITLSEPSFLDKGLILDSPIKWFLDSATSYDKSILNDFKYIACGNRALNIINEKYNQVFAQKSILFYYNLNSENDSDYINDVSTNQITCDVVGDTNKISSIINKSLNFNGNTYAYSQESSLNIDTSEDCTFGMWFKCKSNDDIKLGTLFDSFIKISYDYENQKLIIDDSNKYDCSIDEYHFLNLLFDNTNHLVYVYLDCESMGQFAFTIDSTTYSIYIGTDELLTDNFYGEIDNLWLLNKSLTLEELLYIYNEKISLISKMGNRLSYYEIYNDEKYEDDTYNIIQSYIKAMDINNEIVNLKNDDSDIYSYQSKFYPIIPSYFNISYKDTNGKTVVIQSNAKGQFYNKEDGEVISGSVDFENGIWNLQKNTIKSISQKTISEPTKTPLENTYEIIDADGEEKWYRHYDIPTRTPQDEIVADEIVKDSIPKVTLEYADENDTSAWVYSEEEGRYYVYNSNGTNKLYINSYVINSDDAETPLCSNTGGKALYLKFIDLINETNQLKSYFDMGEATSTTLYSQNGGITMFLDVACTESNQVTKYNLTFTYTSIVDGETITETENVIGYKLGNNANYYTNLSFASEIDISSSPTITPTTFNSQELAMRYTQTDISENLTLQRTINEYPLIYTVDYVEEINEDIDEGMYPKPELVKNSIIFNYWIEENGVLKKETGVVNEYGGVSGKHITEGNFNYDTNHLYVKFDTEVKSEIIVSFEYYYSLDININEPVVLNYKTKKSIQINEVGLEDENHELLAYMTFPNVEFHNVYDNLSTMFAIRKV